MSDHFGTLYILILIKSEIHVWKYSALTSVSVSFSLVAAWSIANVESNEFRLAENFKIENNIEKQGIYRALTEISLGIFTCTGLLTNVFPKTLQQIYACILAIYRIKVTTEPYKHTTWIPRWNDVETVTSTSFQRGIHVVCL